MIDKRQSVVEGVKMERGREREREGGRERERKVEQCGRMVTVVVPNWNEMAESQKEIHSPSAISSP